MVSAVDWPRRTSVLANLVAMAAALGNINSMLRFISETDERRDALDALLEELECEYKAQNRAGEGASWKCDRSGKTGKVRSQEERHLDVIGLRCKFTAALYVRARAARARRGNASVMCTPDRLTRVSRTG